MPEFNSPADIGNLALQFCGQPPMSATLGFSDNNARARAVSAVYGKCRRAELRRALFKFAIEKAVIRAVDITTMRVVPVLWSSSMTFYMGSIVADVNGTLWQSTINNNTGSGNQPGVNFQVWKPYFGPLTCNIYNPNTSYFSGEMVYTTAGDGTYNVFLSLINGNQLNPSLPSQWNPDSVYQQSQVVQSYPAWVNVTAYTVGQVVAYTDGNYYASLINGNTGNIPPSTIGTAWVLIAPLSLITSIYPSTTSNVPYNQSTPVIEWDIGTTYSAGAFVTFNNRVYVSLVTNTGQFPYITNSVYWARLTGATAYMSLFNLNINNNPASTPAAWSSTTTYTNGALVAATDGFNYLSLQNSNLNNNPANGVSPTWWSQQTLTAWTSTGFTVGPGNQQWLQIGGCNAPTDVALIPESPIYPVGSGPVSQFGTFNIFRLPAGFIRLAPQDPKAGSFSWEGAPSGLAYKDWVLNGDYIVTRNPDPIPLRFQADVQDVSKFDDMFCFGVARRIALEIASQLTQSPEVVRENAAAYREFMGEGRTVSGVESGPTEPPLDDYIACRL